MKNTLIGREITSTLQVLCCLFLMSGNQSSAQVLNGGEGASEPAIVLPTATAEQTPSEPCSKDISSGDIDFEEFSEWDDVSKKPHSASILTKYGVQFTAIKGGSLAIAKIVERDDEEPDFKAWLSVLCPGKPNNNRACQGGEVGKRVLSMTDAKDTKEVELLVTLVEPVDSFSFDILDVDGGETWSITATDSMGQTIPTQKVSSAGYGSNSGNNRTTNFTVQTLGRTIKSVRIVGTKKIDIFGFGFDNFRTGMAPCKP